MTSLWSSSALVFFLQHDMNLLEIYSNISSLLPVPVEIIYYFFVFNAT